MTIATGSIKTESPFAPVLLQAEMDDALFAELLGGLSKPFDVIEKRSYDYVLLDDGIEDALEDFAGALKPLIEREARATESSNGADIDLRRLHRPLILQLKGVGCGKPAVLEMLKDLHAQLKTQGRALAVYPVHEAFASLGGILARDLRSALVLTGIVSPYAIDPEITESFCKATRELFDIQLKTPVKLIGASIRRPGIRHEGFHTGSIELEGGSVSISAMLTIPAHALPELMKRMTGAKQVPDDLLRNGPSEFANVVGGAARGQLNSAGYSLRSPTIPKAYGPESQHLLGAADASTSVEVRLETALGEAFLEIRFFN